jgi:hybrid polyketide synthase/nonribosomal peptide synthetase ACE1
VRAALNVQLPVIKLLESSTLTTMSQLIENREIPVGPIDWDKETALSTNMLRLAGDDPRPVSEDWNVVILTGATGRLGRALLTALVADENVKEIHCIGVRDLGSRLDMLSLPKVQLHGGDLKLPRLGLTEEQARRIFSVAGCIIHNGAQVSHAQSYHSLRLANLQATKELVEMSLPRRIQLHFVSSAEVGTLYAESTGEREFPEISVALYPPGADGSDGYLATKWASERFLERLSHGPGGWPIFIHRPSLISRAQDEPSQDIVQNLRHYAIRMAAVPIAPNYSGYLDTVSQEAVVSGILGALREHHEVGLPGVRFRHYSAGESLSLDDPRESLGVVAVEELPVLIWASRAADLGLDAGIVKWVESAAGGSRERVFPKIMRR